MLRNDVSVRELHLFLVYITCDTEYDEAREVANGRIVLLCRLNAWVQTVVKPLTKNRAWWELTKALRWHVQETAGTRNGAADMEQAGFCGVLNARRARFDAKWERFRRDATFVEQRNVFSSTERGESAFGENFNWWDTALHYRESRVGWWDSTIKEHYCSTKEREFWRIEVFIPGSVAEILSYFKSTKVLL